MLKIKDNVDLKELEKFGFTYNDKMYEKFFYDDNINRGWIEIREDERILTNAFYIKLNQRYPNCYVLVDSTIYDLIKADLVEKVEE